MLVKGIPASPGVVIGKAFVLKSESLTIPKYKISPKKVPQEIKRFVDALAQTRGDLLRIQKKVEQEMGESYPEIFSAHLLILEDPVLREETIKGIEDKHMNAEELFSRILHKIGETFSHIEDEYLKERAHDIRDVGRRVLRNLIGKKEEALSDLKDKVVVVAHDLAPSETAQMDKGKVLGFATDIGGRTSHTVIMARSLTIPAVVGLRDVTEKTQSGDTIILDGNRGIALVNPEKITLERYRRRKRYFTFLEKKLDKLREVPTQTLDGHRVKLLGNIELPQEMDSLKKYGAEGVGLYRTEFFFLNREKLPTEEEQFQTYKYVTEKASPHPVVIRTLDLGGDKFASHLETPKEINPLLGCRAIRFCLTNPDIFKTQLRAILRASSHGNVQIMYPMISTLSELKQANKILNEVKEDLKKEKKSFNPKMEIGVMVETPSAAMISDLLASEVDFFSIGTNDLIQYAMAADRINERVAYLYQPSNPAVLRFIKHIIDYGHSKGIRVAMCGEIAGDIHFTLLFLGLGLDEFSMAPLAIPQIKQIIRSVEYNKVKEIVEKVLSFDSAKKVMDYLKRIEEPLGFLEKLH